MNRIVRFFSVKTSAPPPISMKMPVLDVKVCGELLPFTVVAVPATLNVSGAVWVMVIMFALPSP